jgi:peptide/nickel transport system ATP-binding protein
VSADLRPRDPDARTDPEAAPVPVRLRDVHHGYGRGDDRVEVLRGVDLEIPAGVRLGLAGPSGVGKSTLGRVLCLLEAPNAGRVEVDGRAVRGRGLEVPRDVRRRVHLLWQAPRPAVDPRARLREIVAEPIRIVRGRASVRAASGEIDAVAASVGLTPELLLRRPSEVSDGQLQRACVARALLADPAVLVADEPGAMLDVSTQAALLEVLAELVAARGTSVVLISHDALLLEHWCDRVLQLDEGRLVG